MNDNILLLYPTYFTRPHRFLVFRREYEKYVNGREKRRVGPVCSLQGRILFFFFTYEVLLTEPSRVEWSQAVTNNERRCYLRLLTAIFGNLARATGEVTTWERLRYLQLPRGPDCLTAAPPETWKIQIRISKSRRIRCKHIVNGHFETVRTS